VGRAEPPSCVLVSLQAALPGDSGESHDAYQYRARPYHERGVPCDGILAIVNG
jgi:hypothetical protein